ncbi:DNA-binding LacI/PurR family transcriptional regulator [Microbacterium natoriense]|uniref:DNA-binding LacI/PurR family transcriptional regulator n=1 Tax=Microbacterium natoriense TaxID=284570 RepID=A0AAW8EYS0_9MICO|nr:LacI family DNA-binding transcriptional regulator [Microbacterium natoriense]MDQ0647959.1 DNA-binding LacI/PurR family transcriptional regulator [Microbacterium natoriense]
MASSRPTVYDVAERAGVSIATVSFAFRRPEKVRPETRASVLEAARAIGYVPSGSARNLARGRTGVLGLHLFDMLLDGPPDGALPQRPDAHERRVDLDTLDLDADLVPWDAVEDARLSEPQTFPLYVDEVQRGFVLECKRNGRAVLLSTGGTDVRDVADTAGRVDGLAVLPGQSAMASLASVAVNLPVVVLSSETGDGHRVLVDNIGGERMLVGHLIEEHGVRTLGWIGADLSYDYAERMDAFFRILDEHGGGVVGEALDGVDLDSSPEFLHVVARARAGTLPDALVCASDQVAIALIDVLRAEGIEAPRDVLIVGFDGILAARMSSPTLTTVRQPMELMGRVAAHLLLTDPGDGSVPLKTVRLGVGLQIGESCGCSR